MSVLLTSDTYINGVLTTAGATVSLGYIPEYNLVYEGSGTWVSIPNVIPNTVRNARSQPYILAQSGVPVGIANNGTVATNGQITLGTALPRTYSDGIWLYLPAGAVSGGAAGLYWCVMSSPTVGQVYTKFADTSQIFLPYIPTGVLVNAVGSNTAYTQITATDIVLANITLPGGSLGNNGSVSIISSGHMATAAAGSKYVKTYYAAGQFWLTQNTATSGNYKFSLFAGFMNCGATNSQVETSADYSWGSNAVSGTLLKFNVDSTVDQLLKIVANIPNATESIIYETISIEVLPS
jgi:hypothetical protein